MKAERDCEPERCDDSNTIGTGLPVGFSEVDATASAAFLEPQDAATFPLDSRSQGSIPGRRWTGIRKSHWRTGRCVSPFSSFTADSVHR